MQQKQPPTKDEKVPPTRKADTPAETPNNAGSGDPPVKPEADTSTPEAWAATMIYQAWRRIIKKVPANAEMPFLGAWGKTVRQNIARGKDWAVLPLGDRPVDDAGPAVINDLTTELLEKDLDRLKDQGVADVGADSIWRARRPSLGLLEVCTLADSGLGEAVLACGGAVYRCGR